MGGTVGRSGKGNSIYYCARDHVLLAPVIDGVALLAVAESEILKHLEFHANMLRALLTTISERH